MDKLLIVTGICVLLAYLAQRNGSYRPIGERQPWNQYVFLLILVFALFAGLRTDYNDTANYRSSYIRSETLAVFLEDPENLEWTQNPLFYGITALFKTLGIDVQLYFIFFAALDTALLVRFVQRYAPEKYFAFGIFMFFTLGTAVFSLAAMKQITAMAIFTVGVPYLLDRKWIPYLLIVLIAGLIHTYAFLLAILPLFLGKPWQGWTLALVGFTIAVLLTFENTIRGFLEFADSYGKHLAEEEVLATDTMNLFRVAVYAIVPVASLIYRKDLEIHMRREHCLLINMSIFSLMFMLMASMAGANMFGRMANYFELGTICVMPWMIDKLFTGKTRWFVYRVAAICFIGFFIYDNKDFGAYYRAISLF